MDKRYSYWAGINNRKDASVAVLQVKPTKGILRADQFIIDFMKDNHTNSILDFGSGYGRNTFALAGRTKIVWAYDFPNMIKLLTEDIRFKDYDNIHTTSNWEEVKEQQFDAIVCVIVLQHICCKDLESYLKDFLNISKNLYVQTRVYIDFTKEPIYPILTKYWKHCKSYSGKHTPEVLRTYKRNEHYCIHLIAK